MKKRPLLDRFFEKVEKTEKCWLWTASKNTSGYGNFGDGTPQNKLLLVHRFSWQIHKGEIPNNLWVLHKCDVRHCVNPDHLYLGTLKNNIKDMMDRKRNRVPIGEEHYLTKLKTHDVKIIRQLFGLGLKRKEIAKLYKISLKNVRDVIARKTWNHVD